MKDEGNRVDLGTKVVSKKQVPTCLLVHSTINLESRVLMFVGKVYVESQELLIIADAILPII